MEELYLKDLDKVLNNNRKITIYKKKFDYVAKLEEVNTKTWHKKLIIYTEGRTVIEALRLLARCYSMQKEAYQNISHDDLPYLDALITHGYSMQIIYTNFGKVLTMLEIANHDVYLPIEGSLGDNIEDSLKLFYNTVKEISLDDFLDRGIQKRKERIRIKGE